MNRSWCDVVFLGQSFVALASKTRPILGSDLSDDAPVQNRPTVPFCAVVGPVDGSISLVLLLCPPHEVAEVVVGPNAITVPAHHPIGARTDESFKNERMNAAMEADAQAWAQHDLDVSVVDRTLQGATRAANTTLIAHRVPRDAWDRTPSFGHAVAASLALRFSSRAFFQGASFSQSPAIRLPYGITSSTTVARSYFSICSRTAAAFL